MTGYVRANGTGDSTRVADLSARAISSDAIGPAIGHPVYGGFVELRSEDPGARPPLEPVELPELDNGPHFFYGLQWWFFGVLAVFGFFYLLYDEWRNGPRGERLVRVQKKPRPKSKARLQAEAAKAPDRAGEARTGGGLRARAARRRRPAPSSPRRTTPRARAGRPPPGRTPRARRSGPPAPVAVDPSSASRSVRIAPGSSPFTRIPRGASSSARVLATIASPGRSPFETARSGSGTRTLVESTKAIEPPSPSSPARTRARRTAPRKTASNAEDHCSSVIPRTPPRGGPPTLTRAPSSRPQRSERPHQPRRGLRVGVVGRDTDGALAQRLDGGVERLLRPARQHHPRALGDEHLGRGSAQPAGGAGDEVDAIGQPQVHGLDTRPGSASPRPWAR